MRVVLDTNIFVSGIHWAGDSEKVLRKWFHHEFDLVSSVAIIEEMTRILSSFKIPMETEDILWWRTLVLERSIIIEPVNKLNIVKEDPGDNKFIEAALEGKANYIITQDNHLLKIKKYKSIKIVSPSEFLRLST